MQPCVSSMLQHWGAAKQSKSHIKQQVQHAVALVKTEAEVIAQSSGLNVTTCVTRSAGKPAAAHMNAQQTGVDSQETKHAADCFISQE